MNVLLGIGGQRGGQGSCVGGIVVRSGGVAGEGANIVDGGSVKEGRNVNIPVGGRVSIPVGGVF